MKASAISVILIVCLVGLSNSCKVKEHRPIEKDSFYNPFIQTESVRISNMQKWSSAYGLDRTYYLDFDSLSQEDFYVAIEDHQVGHIYEYITDPKMVEADIKQDTIKPRIIFHYQSTVFGLSSEYIDEHLFVPDFIDLHINEYDNLFLSLGTSQQGIMNAAIYNKDNGFRIGVFSDNNYEGNFLEGHLVQHLDSVRDVTLALVIADSIYFHDFSQEELFGTD